MYIYTRRRACRHGAFTSRHRYSPPIPEPYRHAYHAATCVLRPSAELLSLASSVPFVRTWFLARVVLFIKYNKLRK